MVVTKPAVPHFWLCWSARPAGAVLLPSRHGAPDCLRRSPVSPGPAADLLDFGDGQLAKGKAVVLGHCLKDDSLDLEVEAHADGVARGQKVVAAVGIVKQACLLGSRLRRQRAVDNGTATARRRFDAGLQRMQAHAREGHDGIARAQVLEVAVEALRHGLQRAQPLVAVHDALVSDAGADGLDQVHGALPRRTDVPRGPARPGMPASTPIPGCRRRSSGSRR